MEENKINSRQISPKKSKKNNKEVVEISLGRPNPAFNLVSIKARFRFHQIKENFTKLDYKEYMRKCKNMYSISSKLSSELNMSDILFEEKKNINDILSMYHRIDDKISSKRIRLTKVKKDNPKVKLLKEKSVSAVNLLKEKSSLFKFRITANDFKSHQNNTKLQSQEFHPNKNRNYNNNNEMLRSTYNSNFKGDFSNVFINSKMNNTNYKQNSNQNNHILIKTNSFFEKNNKDFSKTFYPSFNQKKIISNTIFEKKENNNIISNQKKSYEDFGLYNFKTKQCPLSGKSSGLTITNFGAIIYNNSIFRNKKISNFLYNNQSLPSIYSIKY